MKIVDLSLSLLISLCMIGCNNSDSTPTQTDSNNKDTTKTGTTVAPKPVQVDSADYRSRMLALANGDTMGRWPVNDPVPLPGALLPYHRIIAYYGNLYSTRMGILGEIPKKEMFKKLQGEVERWQKADSSVKVIPALHYIGVTAQSAPGKGNKYRLRMPFHQIDTILNWAHEINAPVFVDIQVGHSTVQEEVPELEKYLSMPDLHLGIDPEFSMKGGERPGAKIGTFDAKDINWVIDYLASLVKKNNIPPKILVLHRFTQGMLTNYDKIKLVPEVQVIVEMDGFGSKVLKRSTWNRYITKEPVQFTGFKIFYKNDTKHDPNGAFTPEELMKLSPKPIYIQYQ